MGAAVVQGIGAVLVSAYFFLGSAVVTLTFFGDQPSDTELRQATAMRVGLVVSVLVGGGSAVAVTAVRQALWERGDLRQPWTLWLGLGWVAGFALALLIVVPVLGNFDKPVGFGLVWLAVGAVVSPAALAVTEIRSRSQ